ncbi:hypothetical protein MJO28_000091 [Puccinia striiformis f. sp. tritici]|uniref:Uncharacterized protein n=1 Tax=Puccinia striiformis f. sp. tritici TaxID=168172 RepID=A0ACC0EX45_9BASI|nr:hypothetical protein Pst134EB_002359 [Puccinia striiformis f. sp. tritici]KAI7961997.1 hypothetical protein MJO28_000091 [Puccinia striiformis f. sp. tritici]KAI9626000.1 hypothetical protein H4Q26_015988 [Puccinia striiformis f. sp. tritici PST-130]
MDLSAYEPIPSSSISRINSRPPAIANKLIPHTQLDTQTCSLLGPFSILIQAIMALIILASLLYKRHREKPKRKYRIWTADVSKQVLGQAFVHMLNIFISDSMASLPSKGNPCALYFMNIFIDTTIGVFVLFLALNFITLLVCKTLKKTSTNLGLSSGIYPDPFIKSWMKQLSIYFIGLIILKLFVLGLFWLGGSALIKFGNSIIEAISLDPKIQILVVVMIGPTILNVLQFLLIDSFIKHKPHTNLDYQSQSEDGRRFLNNPEDSDSDQDDNDDNQNNEDQDDEDDNGNGRKPRGPKTQDRIMPKKSNQYNNQQQNDQSTRESSNRLDKPTNLHESSSSPSSSSVKSDVHQNPHSYPPKTSRSIDHRQLLPTVPSNHSSINLIELQAGISARDRSQLITNLTHHHQTSVY